MMEDRSLLLVRKAARELETIRSVPKHAGVRFPPSCCELVMELPGNDRCVDCNSPNPEWASVTFGTLLCMQCSGKHRSFGVQTSFVRSVRMDTWSHSQILAMLEGGNDQLKGFFYRHEMDNSANRYFTKASQFYRTHLAKHVDKVSKSGSYEGREASRGRSHPQRSSSSSSLSSSSSSLQRQQRRCVRNDSNGTEQPQLPQQTLAAAQ